MTDTAILGTITMTLKPCPFCGDEPWSGPIRRGFAIQCVNLKCCVKPAIARAGWEEVVSDWNTRAMHRAAPAGMALHVVFDGPPGHESGRFVECETPDGRSINAGEWHERNDGLWELRIPNALTAAPAGITDEDIRAIRQLEADVQAYSGNEASGRNEILRRKAAAYDAVRTAMHQVTGQGDTPEYRMSADEHDAMRRALKASVKVVGRIPREGDTGLVERLSSAANDVPMAFKREGANPAEIKVAVRLDDLRAAIAALQSSIGVES
jgi:hypothetical protein